MLSSGAAPFVDVALIISSNCFCFGQQLLQDGHKETHEGLKVALQGGSDWDEHPSFPPQVHDCKTIIFSDWREKLGQNAEA
jgi:hypothetical protein